MSQLELYFRGFFRVDPPTANNNRIDNLLDLSEPSLSNYWGSLPDDQLHKSLTTLEKKIEPQVDGTTPIVEQLPSYWNYYGSYGFWFNHVAITGSNLSTHDDDPLLGSLVSLKGQKDTKPLMLQIDPTGATSAQIFSGLLDVGQNGCRLVGESPSRAFLRGLHFPRNLKPADVPEGTSAIFQSIIKPEDITIENDKDSKLLGLINEGLENGLWLQFRYCLYFTPPAKLSPEELAIAYAAGETPHNPKQGRLIGLITLVEPTPLPSVPPGRLLQAPFVFSFADKNLIPLGQALVAVDYEQCQVHLDFLSTIPEVDASLEKLNLGTGLLQAVDDAGETYPIAEINYQQYSKQAYEASSGQIKLSFVPELRDAIRNGRLQISFPHAEKLPKTPAILEVAYDIQTEARCIYFYTKEPQTIQVHVSYLGQPARQIPVALGQWLSNTADVGARSEQKAQPEYGYVVSKGYSPRILTVDPPVAMTDDKGIATFTLLPHSDGATRIYFWVPGAQPEPTDTSEFAMGSIPYATARVFPTDSDLDSITNPDWDTVYEKVLRYFNFIYPGMNQIFSLSDPAVVQAHAARILYRIDRKLWHTTLYMPTSRELTIGKENLLRRWLLQSLIEEEKQQSSEQQNDC